MVKLLVKKQKNIKSIFKNNVNQKINFKSLKASIDKVKNNYLGNLKPLATRKTSEMFLDIASKLPNLIGGSQQT